jgi:hypothetical protein
MAIPMPHQHPFANEREVRRTVRREGAKLAIQGREDRERGEFG